MDVNLIQVFHKVKANTSRSDIAAGRPTAFDKLRIDAVDRCATDAASARAMYPRLWARCEHAGAVFSLMAKWAGHHGERRLHRTRGRNPAPPAHVRVFDAPAGVWRCAWCAVPPSWAEFAAPCCSLPVAYRVALRMGLPAAVLVAGVARPAAAPGRSHQLWRRGSAASVRVLRSNGLCTLAEPWSRRLKASQRVYLRRLWSGRTPTGRYTPVPGVRHIRVQLVSLQQALLLCFHDISEVLDENVCVEKGVPAWQEPGVPSRPGICCRELQFSCSQSVAE